MHRHLILAAALFLLPFSAHATLREHVALAGCCPVEATVTVIDATPAGAPVPTFVLLAGSSSNLAGPAMMLTFDDPGGIPELADAFSHPSYPVTIGTDEIPIPPAPAGARTSAVLFCTLSEPFMTSFQGVTGSGALVTVDFQWSPVGQDAEGNDIPPPIQYSEGGAYVMDVGSPATQLRTRGARAHRGRSGIAVVQ